MLKTSIHKTVMQETELDSYIGTFLNNRYLIRDLIGKGGMGRVYIAEDVAKGGMPVAVKLLYMNLVNQQMSQRFAREIFIGSQLGRKSQHIVRILSYGITEDNIPFYVMEYLQGKNLKQILQEKPLTVEQFLDVCSQICSGLQCAHEGVNLKGEIVPIIHRDIKPENIFFPEEQKFSSAIKILDFGIAKFMTERAGMTLTESFIGSLPYCSPEHMEGRKLLDVRSDIYSLGVIMFEMLTGKHPFFSQTQSFGDWYQAHHFQTPPNIKEVNPQLKVPQQLNQLVMQCLSKEVDKRPENVTSILTVLNEIKNSIHSPHIECTSVPDSNSVQLIPVASLTEKECWQQSWPNNKPVQTIGFPHLLNTQNGSVPTFWAMLPQAEITNLIEAITLTEFISNMNTYPMILWTTIVYNQSSTFHRCLSYYLDLKSNNSKVEKIISKLAETGYYHLLFFSLEEPQKCSQVRTISLTTNQRKELAFYLENSHTYSALISQSKAKNHLKFKQEQVRKRVVNSLKHKGKHKKNQLTKWVSKLICVIPLWLFNKLENISF